MQSRTPTAKRGRSALWVVIMIAAMLAAGCGREQQAAHHSPQPIASGDECHVCGMLIKRFPGPKAEAFVAGSDKPFKFCSTRDLFAYLLQPETKSQVREVYVHDMGATSWAHPDDDAFVDARHAWYVVGQDKHGAMGPTLASFKQRKAAEAFAQAHGGRVLGFVDISLQVLASLNGSESPGGAGDGDRQGPGH